MAEEVKDKDKSKDKDKDKGKGKDNPSRRRAERFDLNTPLDVTVLRSGIPDTVPGRTVDASENGLAAMLAGELTPGETVGLQVQLPAMADPLRTRAKVKYQDNLRCGLEFLWLSDDERAALRESAKGKPVLAVNQSEKQKLEKKPVGKETSIERSTERRTSRPEGGGAPSHLPPAIPSQSSPRKMWIIAAVLIVALAIGGGVFWWRWNRGWEELESGLKIDPAASTERPQVQVAAEVMEKLLIHRVEPVYPVEARRANVQGVIALDIVIGRDGTVASMRPINGPDVLARAAMDALRWWRFEPYRLNGEPAVVETTVAVEFKP
jgi:TonB family protein